ncbi:hypothetical protein AMTR_s00040p00109870 [Amborella trichopoda]|uniref:Uncharacterized protein n=1 Tax=Amborella trichopoda TaxID=13333 RepID=W1PYJ3_AMBTC|nr:hypothetical protein AMTR_s00040p00109870 [Amborella trichopoda]
MKLIDVDAKFLKAPSTYEETYPTIKITMTNMFGYMKSLNGSMMEQKSLVDCHRPTEFFRDRTFA